MKELEQLVDELGRRSIETRLGRHEVPESFDEALWDNLEETGLARLTSSGDAGPAEAAVVLSGLARHAVAAPIAETDLLAAWLANAAGLSLPDSGPLTVAIADGVAADGRITGFTRNVPWPNAFVVLAVRTDDAVLVAAVDPSIVVDHNLAGEPRGSFRFELPTDDVITVEPAVADQLTRRGAWSRCVQILGAFDAARDLTVAHTCERTQFGRPLSRFQSVQHLLAAMAGEIERACAATSLAVAAAADYGFDAPATDYAVTVAKVTVGRAVAPLTTIAHQLHGAIGVTMEHRLWLATMRARSWVDEFGTTGEYARRLGRMAMAAADPWDLVVSGPALR